MSTRPALRQQPGCEALRLGEAFEVDTLRLQCALDTGHLLLQSRDHAHRGLGQLLRTFRISPLQPRPDADVHQEGEAGEDGGETNETK
jgi:hypothetical protein